MIQLVFQLTLTEQAGRGRTGAGPGVTVTPEALPGARAGAGPRRRAGTGDRDSLAAVTVSPAGQLPSGPGGLGRSWHSGLELSDVPKPGFTVTVTPRRRVTSRRRAAAEAPGRGGRGRACLPS